MAANALVQTRIDGAIKEEAAVVLESIGLTVSDAVRLMLVRVAHDKALPFEPLIPNKKTLAAMKEARSGKLETVSLDDLRAVLDAGNLANFDLQARSETRVQRPIPGFPCESIRGDRAGIGQR
jgi:DNA-damage-inducible protein J